MPSEEETSRSNTHERPASFVKPMMSPSPTATQWLDEGHEIAENAFLLWFLCVLHSNPPSFVTAIPFPTATQWLDEVHSSPTNDVGAFWSRRTLAAVVEDITKLARAVVAKMRRRRIHIWCPYILVLLPTLGRVNLVSFRFTDR